MTMMEEGGGDEEIDVKLLKRLRKLEDESYELTVGFLDKEDFREFMWFLKEKWFITVMLTFYSLSFKGTLKKILWVF